MKKTLIVWRRFGKEHEEGEEFRVNAPEVVSASIQGRVEKFRQAPADDWRWWQISEDVLVEKPLFNAHCGPYAIIYYLPRRNWVILEHARFSRLEGWDWYVHIGNTRYHPEYESWVFTDLFCDVVVKDDDRTHSVLDLDEAGKALEMGLITAEQLSRILADTQKLIDLVRSENFPPPELGDRHRFLQELGWAV